MFSKDFKTVGIFAYSFKFLKFDFFGPHTLKNQNGLIFSISARLHTCYMHLQKSTLKVAKQFCPIKQGLKKIQNMFFYSFKHVGIYAYLARTHGRHFKLPTSVKTHHFLTSCLSLSFLSCILQQMLSLIV